MKFAWLAGLALLSGATASHAADAEPTGTNCAIYAAPAEAGESPDRDFFRRVYPRGPAITADYTGCQTLWTPQGRGWGRVSVTVIVEGDPVRLWLPARPADPVNACRYAKGRLIVGDAHVCPSPRVLMPQTFPAGCTERLREADGEAVWGCPFE